MARPLLPNVTAAQYQRDRIKSWTSEDNTVLEQACETGRLPDGRVATQMRLAILLGFSRQTIIKYLAGRRLPLCNELMREGGRNSAYGRAVRRVATILQQSAKARMIRQ